MPNKKYILEMEAEQFKVMLPALDLAMRLHIGQLGMINEFLSSEVKTPNDVPFFDDEVRAHLSEVKQRYFGNPNLNAGPGIHNQGVSDRARMLMDIHDVIRNKIAWDEHKPGEPTLYVQFDTPRQSSKFALPVMKDIAEDTSGPKFTHNCDKCTFVGRVRTKAGLEADLYINCSHEPNELSYIVRYSSDLFDFVTVVENKLWVLFE